MGFFSEKNIDLKSLSLNQYLIPTPIEQNLIDKCSTIKGDISSCSNIIIKGKILGNVESNSTIIVAKDAIIQGNINAKSLRIEGKVEGDIICELLEVRKEAFIKASTIEAINCYCNGTIEGDIKIKEEFLLEKNGVVNAFNIKAQTLISNGTINAKFLTSDFFHFQANSLTKASMQSKSLICDFGAKLEGDIVSSKELSFHTFKKTQTLKKEIRKINTKKEQASA